MNNIHKAKAKEQAEAYIRQLRTIPRSEAVHVMEQLLEELFKWREMYTTENIRSCTDDQSE